MANNSVKILIETLYKGRGAKEAQKDLQGLGKSGVSAKDALVTLGSSIAIATGAFAALGAAAKKAFDLGAEGAQIERLNDSFRSLSTSAGESSDRLLTALNRAASGTISNTDLILSANRAMMLGLGADADQLANLLEVAAFRGRAMGLSTTQAFNDIVTGVGRASPMILDNLGIVVDAEKTYSEYADAIGKSKDELSKAEKTQALMTRVLEEGNRQIELAGGYADDAATSYERLSAQSKTMVDNWKQQVGEGLEPVVKWLGEAIQRSNDYERAIQISGIAYEDFNDAARAAGMSATEFTQSILDSADATEEAGSGLDGWGRKLEDITPAIEDNTEALKEQSKAFQTILDNMFSIQSASEKYTETIAKLDEKQIELEQEKVELVLSGGEKEKQLKRDLIELDRDIANARATGVKTEEQAFNLGERIHDMLVRREDILQKIRDLNSDSVVDQVDLDNQLAQIEQQRIEAAEEQAKARKQLVYQMLEQKAAQDDIITTDELRFLQDTAVQMGLVDRASADMAIAASEAADTMWEQFQKPGEAVGDVQDALNRLVQGSPYRAQIVVETAGGIPDLYGYTGFSGGYTSPPASGAAVPLGPVAGPFGYAEGGDFIVPPGYPNDSYMMGVTSGERVTVSPDGQGGEKNVNIYIDKITDRNHIKFLAQEVGRELQR